MRKARKRVLSTLLAAVLALGLMPSFAFATTPASDTGEEAGISALAVTEVDDADGNLFSKLTGDFRIYNGYWADIVTEQPDGYEKDSENETVTISTAAGLVWWAKEVNRGASFADYSVNITADIDLSGHYWTPIDTATIKYTEGENGEISWGTTTPNKKLDGAVIDGNGYTITGLATATGLRGPAQPSEPGDGQNCYYYSAFIGRNDGDLTIRNISFDDASIAITEPAEGVAEKGSSMCAVVTAINSGDLFMNSVSVTNSDVLAMQKASALLGMPSGGSFTVNKCTVTGCNMTAYFQVAPIVGYVGTAGYPLSVNGIKLEGNTTTIVKQGGNWSYKSFDGGVYYGNSEYYGDSYYIGASETAVLANVGASSEGGFSHEGLALKLVAEVGGYQYGTLSAAIAAAQDGETVTLLKDDATAETIEVKEDITLDLGGRTVSPHQLKVYANLTIRDSGGSGKLAPTIGAAESAAIDVGSTGCLTLESGTIESGANTYGVYVHDNGKAIVKGGAINSGYAPLSGNNTAGDMNFEVHGGTLTAALGPAIYMPGQVNLTVTGGTLNGGISLRMGQVNISGGTINAITDKIDSPEDYYNFSGNAWLPDALYVFNGTYTSENEPYGNSLNLNITGGTFNCTNDQGSAVAIYDLGKVKQVSNVTISGDAKLSSVASGRGAYQVLSLNDIGVTAPADGYGANDGSVKSAISGGYFTSDPSTYVAAGSVAVESDEPGYNFMVVEKKATAAEVVAAAPSVAEPNLPGGATDGDKNLASDVKAALTEGSTSPSIGQGALEAAANAVANENTLTAESEEVTSALNEAKIDTSGKTVTIVVQPYLDITIKGAVAEEADKSVTLDITPMYKIVATTANLSDPYDKIVLAGSEGGTANAVQIGEEAKLNITQPVTVTVPLPSGFASGDTLYVEHQKSAGRTYFYTGAVASDVLTFTNPNGFSLFTISATNGAEAELNGICYGTLSSALADAGNGDTVTVLQNNLTASMSGASRDVTLENGTGEDITVTINGKRVTIGAGETASFSYSAPAPVPTPEQFDVAVADVQNGAVELSAKTAKEGQKVTVTVTPDLGWELAQLTVADEDGDALELTENADGTYSFTMPAGDVTVHASFADAWENPFTDLSEDHWGYGAVRTANLLGLMKGIGGTTLFGPDDGLLREQAATVMWNLMGAGDVSRPEAPQADVDQSQWYAPYVNWAVDSKVMDGYSEDDFGVGDSLTREQFAAVVAKAVGADVDSADQAALGAFPDADGVSGWARATMAWAVEAGVLNGVETEDGSRELQATRELTRAEMATMMVNAIEVGVLDFGA